MDLSYGLCDGYAKYCVAIEHGDADLDLSDLPVEVPCHERLAYQLYAMHLAFDATSAVVSAPSFPDGSAEIA